MVDQIAVVTVDVPSGAANFQADFTHASITEAFSAALFFWHGSDTDSSDIDHGLIGMGCCTPSGTTAQRNAGYNSQGSNASINAPDYNTNRDQGDSTPGAITLTLGTASGTYTVKGVYNSSIAGGVRMDFTGLPNSVSIKVTAILFAGLTEARCGRTSGSGTVTETYAPAATLTADLLVFFGGGGTGNVDSPDAQLDFGAAMAGIVQKSCFHNHDDVTEPTDADGAVDGSSAFCGHQGTTRTVRYGEVSAISSTGFTWAGRVGGVASSAMYLALEFSGNVRVAIANMALPSGTGDAAFNTFGFTPDLVFGMSKLIASENTETDGSTAASCGMFATGRYGSRAVTMHGEEANPGGTGVIFNTHNRAEDVALLTYTHTGTIAQRATWVGASGSGGFILNFSTATAGFMTAVGIQLVPNPPLPVRRPTRRAKIKRKPQKRLHLVGGKAPASGIIKLLKTVARFRRSMQARLRWKPRLIANKALVGLEVDESKAAISAPGMIRATVVGSGTPTGDHP